MQNIETNEKIYHRIVEQDSHLKLVKTDVKPDYLDTEVKILNNYIKNYKQKISFLTLANKVATSLRQHSCKTMEDAKKANLIYDEPIIDYCLPQLDKINVKIKDSRYSRPTDKELVLYRQEFVKYREQLKKYKIIPSTPISYLASNIESINDSALKEYHIDEQIRKTTRQLLNYVQIHNYYSDFIKDNTTEINRNSEFLKILETIKKDSIQNKTGMGLATPNDVRIASIGTKQPLKWLEVEENNREKVKELLKSTAPEILQKLEDDDNPNEIIAHFIGIKLTKIELRILKTLRALVDRAFKLEEIHSYSHKVRIIRTDFYKEYGLKVRSCGGGYDDNQTKKIREVLFSGTSNLTKRMFFKNSKNKTVLITAFILKIEWEEEQNNYFDIMLDDIIFVKDKSDKYSYYYEDLQGLNRLLELMPNSKNAFDIHGYLEYSVRLNIQEFGITKIAAVNDGLAKRYQKHKKETERLIEEVLDNMVKAKTIISKWQKAVGRNETKYKLTNIRQKEINNNQITKSKKREK
jgi:hypothetical protein